MKYKSKLGRYVVPIYLKKIEFQANMMCPVYQGIRLLTCGDLGDTLPYSSEQFFKEVIQQQLLWVEYGT